MPNRTPQRVSVKSLPNVGMAETMYPLPMDMLWVEDNLTLYKYLNTALARNGTTILDSMLGGNHKWVGMAGQYPTYAPARKMYDAIVNITGTPGVDCDYDDIQSAIDDGMKTIFIRKGTFTFGGDFSLSGLSDILLIGEDRDTVIIQGDDSCNYAMNMASCSRMKFENITFGFTGLSSVRDCLVYNSGTSEYITFKNCRFRGDSPRGTSNYIERGIYSTNGNKKYWLITECIFEQLNYSGITMYDGGSVCDIITVTYNKFINGNGNFGIDTFQGCHYWLIAFNHFENLSSPVASISGALFFNGSGGGRVNWNHSIICNVFKDCPLSIQFDHDCHDILVQGNQFYNGSVHIRFCGSNNTGHHVSNNFNRNGGTLNIQLDWTTLTTTSMFFIGGNWADMPWRVVGAANQPAYKGPWNPYGTSGGAQFVTTDTHEVVLRGQVQNGAPGPIFYLPAGHWPAYDMAFAVASHDGANPILGIIGIQAVDGAVSMMAGNSVMMSLDGVRFRLVS